MALQLDGISCSVTKAAIGGPWKSQGYVTYLQLLHVVRKFPPLTRFSGRVVDIGEGTVRYGVLDYTPGRTICGCLEESEGGQFESGVHLVTGEVLGQVLQRPMARPHACFSGMSLCTHTQVDDWQEVSNGDAVRTRSHRQACHVEANHWMPLGG